MLGVRRDCSTGARSCQGQMARLATGWRGESLRLTPSRCISKLRAPPGSRHPRCHGLPAKNPADPGLFCQEEKPPWPSQSDACHARAPTSAVPTTINSASFTSQPARAATRRFVRTTSAVSVAPTVAVRSWLHVPWKRRSTPKRRSAMSDSARRCSPRRDPSLGLAAACRIFAG